MASPIYGVAFLNIQPDLKGFGASLTRGVGASSASAGATSGVAFGKAFIGGLAAIGIGRVIASQISASIDESIKFESAFAGVLKTVDGTVGQIDQLRTGIIEMSKVLPASREEIAGVAEAAGQLGIQTENILEFTKVMIDLGETTDLTADQAATAFAQIANVMKTPQTAFENMASTLVDLGNKGASTESQIIDFAQRIAGAGEIAGLAEADVLSIGSAMASVGVEAEAGGTAVQKVLLAITEAVATTNDDLDVFAQTAGLSAQAFAKAWGEDAAGAFTLFVEGLGRAGDGAFQILDELELTDQRLIRAFLSLAGASDLLATQIDIGTQAWDENNAASEEANKRYETSAARLEVVKNRATELQRQFGDRLVPIIVDLAEQHIPALENAFTDLTTSMPGEADAQDFINFLSDIPRGIGSMVGLAEAQFNTFTGLVEGFSSVLTAGLVGDTGPALDRITGAWEDFAQDNVIRTATQGMIQNLREGEDSALAFANALAFVGRKGKIDPKVIRTLSQIADVDPSQLILELERLVDLAPELGLGADDIEAIAIALTDLGPPSIEAIRQQNLLARGAVEVGQAFRSVPLNLEATRSKFTEVFLAAAEAELGLNELVDGTNAVGTAIFNTLNPVDQFVLKLDLVRKGIVGAADAFQSNFKPALSDVGQAIGDAVSVDSFINSLEAANAALLEFKINQAAIAGISPELAAALASLPDQVQAALLAEGFAKADPATIFAAAEAVTGDPDDIADAILEIYLDGLKKVDGADTRAVERWLGIIADTIEEDLPGVTTILAGGFQPALNASFADLEPPDLTDLVTGSFEGMNASAITASLDRALSASFADVELPDTTAQMTASIRGWDSKEIARNIEMLFEGVDFALDFSDEGIAAGKTLINGMVTGISSRDATGRLHVAIEDATNKAIEARSPSRLMLRIGGEAGNAFWSGFISEPLQIAIDPPLGEFQSAGLSAGDSFAEGFTEALVDGFAEALRRFEGQFSLGPGFDELTAEQVLSLNLDPATPLLTGFDPLTVGQLEQLVMEAAESSGGISIGQFTVQNPIGEPTEESVQSALLEVAISPMVNRLVSPGSSI